MLTVGVDMIEIERIQAVVDRRGQRFLDRIYTPRELSYCRGRIPELAVRFAAKEAVAKALGTGIRGLSWREMEVVADRRGKPTVALHGRAAERARALGVLEWAISLSHAREHALAMVAAR